jgi:hypothetical protein
VICCPDCGAKTRQDPPLVYCAKRCGWSHLPEKARPVDAPHRGRGRKPGPFGGVSLLVLAYLRKHGPTVRADLLYALGCGDWALGSAIQRLRRFGLIAPKQLSRSVTEPYRLT